MEVQKYWVIHVTEVVVIAINNCGKQIHRAPLSLTIVQASLQRSYLQQVVQLLANF